MSTGAKQQRLPQPEIPETASIPANRKLVEAALNAHELTGAERQTLRDAWDHSRNWKSEHSLWFRHSAEVERILDRIAPAAKEKKS